MHATAARLKLTIACASLVLSALKHTFGGVEVARECTLSLAWRLCSTGMSVHCSAGCLCLLLASADPLPASPFDLAGCGRQALVRPILGLYGDVYAAEVRKTIAKGSTAALFRTEGKARLLKSRSSGAGSSAEKPAVSATDDFMVGRSSVACRICLSVCLCVSRLPTSQPARVKLCAIAPARLPFTGEREQ
jgi:hypothetical protein